MPPGALTFLVKDPINRTIRQQVVVGARTQDLEPCKNDNLQNEEKTEKENVFANWIADDELTNKICLKYDMKQIGGSLSLF